MKEFEREVHGQQKIALVRGEGERRCRGCESENVEEGWNAC